MNVIKKILTNILIYGTEFIVIMLSVFPIVWVALSSHNNLCFSLVNSLFLTFSFLHRDIF